MKHRLSIGILVLVSLLISPCGGGAAPAAPADAGEGSASEAAAKTPQSGGEIVVAYNDDLATLDPAIGYDWTNWPTIKMVFDGLLDYDSGTTIMPRIAASLPEVRADATVYTSSYGPT